MPVTKEQKEKILKDLKEKIAKHKSIVFVDFTGLKVKDLLDLRKRLKQLDNTLKVAKKTLIGLALKDAGIKIDHKKLPGQLALVFGFADEISPAKTVWQFSQENQNIKIIGGIFENKVLGSDLVLELAKLPPRQELLSSLVRGISAPLAGFHYVLQANIKGLLRVLSQIKNK